MAEVEGTSSVVTNVGQPQKKIPKLKEDDKGTIIEPSHVCAWPDTEVNLVHAGPTKADPVDSGPTIQSLPESLLLLIFSLLDHVKDKCSIARTCRSWSRIIRDTVIWKDYSVQETNNNYNTIKRLLDSDLGSSLLDLELIISEDVNFLYNPSLWTSFPNLEKLRVSYLDLCAFDFHLLPSSLKSLTMYTVSHFAPQSPARITCSHPVLPNLQYLEIEDCQDVFANDVIEQICGLELLLSSNRLQTVIFKLMHYRFSHKSLSKISEKLTMVKHVCLHSHSISEKMFKTFMSPLENVKILNLQFSDLGESDTEALIVPNLSRLRHLQEVYLSMFWELRPEHVKKIVTCLPELKLIQIYRCRRIKKEHLKEIENLKEGLTCQFPEYMRLALF